MAKQRYCHFRIPAGLVEGIRYVVRLTENKYGYSSVSEFIETSVRSAIEREERLCLQRKSLESEFESESKISV